jgi:photosystem II stability/assembly factor-like uncharacterized protein
MPLRLLFLAVFLAALAAPAGAQADTGPFAGLSYRQIGPAISGGRSTAVAGSNRDPALYYAGGAGGGVFKSTDGGASWIPVFDRQPAAPIGAIAVAPQDDRDVWVGTGESNPRNTVESGLGVFHSTDGGRHWRRVDLETSAHVSAISIDPRDRRTVVVGVLGRVSGDSTGRGIFITRDGGAHWQRTLYAGPSSGVSSLARVPNRPSTLFAGVWQIRRRPWRLDSGGPAGGIYRSDDGGMTWRKLTGNGLPPGLTGRIGLAAGSRQRVYALVQSRAGELWRSDNGGTTWRKMPHSPWLGARSFYFSSIFVDPADPDRLINVSLVMSMSTDGGRSFHAIATGAGWDYHAIWWSADGRRIINGSDEGVILSSDGGATFRQPYDLPLAQPYHVGFDRAIPHYRVCVGLQDDNSWCGPSTSDSYIGVMNRDWYQVGPGDGMWALFDPRNPAYIWSTSTASDTGQVYLFNEATKQVYDVSPDAESNGETAAGNQRYRFNWDSPLAFTNDGKALVGGNVVFESADRGQTWQVISPDLTRNDPSKQIDTGGPIGNDESGAETYDTILYLATTPLDDAMIWASTDDGLVQLTRDGGNHWQNVSPPASLVPPWGRIMGLNVGRSAAGTALVAVERHLLGDDRPYVLRTDDYGAHWRSISGNLPADQFVRSIRQDPRNGNVLYAGTNRGIWVSMDGGAHWQSLRLNAPATAIYDLEIQPDANDLVVASHGRGVWILDDLTPLQQWSRTQSSSPTLFAPRDAYRMWQWAPVNTFTDPLVPRNEFVGPNAPYGAIVNYYLPRSAKSVAVEILDARGAVVRRLESKDVPKRIGIDRTSWDLQEDGPPKWTGTFKQNQGPGEGAEVVPGSYTVRLSVDGTVTTQPLTVKADPRDPAASRYQERYDFMSGLYRDLGTIDTILNHIDARIKANARHAAELRAVRRRLTYDPRNIEDLSGPAALRERLLDLISRMSTSYQAPTTAQRAQGAAYRAEVERISTEYRSMNR